MMEKILVYWPKIRRGGVEKSFFQYLNYLSSRNKQISILCDQESKKFIKKKISPKIKRLFLSNNRILRLIQCVFVMYGSEAKIYMSIQLDSFKLLFFLSVLKKIDIYYFERNNQFLTNQINIFWKWAINASVKKMFVNSEYMRKCFKAFYKGRIYRIYNPSISKNIINLKLKKKFNLKKNVKILVSGRNTDQKNLKYILQNIRVIRKVFLKYTIYIYSDNHINLNIKSPLIKKNVKFKKFDPNIIKNLKNFDLCIFPSKYEGFPNFLIELCYFNFPVVVSKFAGHKEFKKMKNCFFFNIENKKSFEVSLKKIKTKKTFTNPKFHFKNFLYFNSCKDFLKKINV